MVACKLSHWVAHSEIPKLDGVVRTACQESVVSILIIERTFVEFHSVDMPLVRVTHCADCFVRICVVDYQLLVRASKDSYG